MEQEHEHEHEHNINLVLAWHTCGSYCIHFVINFIIADTKCKNNNVHKFYPHKLQERQNNVKIHICSNYHVKV